MSPALAGIEAELPKISQECMTANGVTTLPRSNHPPPRQQGNSYPSPVVDLSDVVNDFEATLKRSCKSSKISNHRLTETGKILLLLSIREILGTLNILHY